MKSKQDKKSFKPSNGTIFGGGIGAGLGVGLGSTMYFLRLGTKSEAALLTLACLGAGSIVGAGIDYSHFKLNEMFSDHKNLPENEVLIKESKKHTSIKKQDSPKWKKGTQFFGGMGIGAGGLNLVLSHFLRFPGHPIPLEAVVLSLGFIGLGLTVGKSVDYTVSKANRWFAPPTVFPEITEENSSSNNPKFGN
ncbi:MAG: hypothetical protein HYX60_08325 [Legionella longbeachae]|nr:hypothetical protein [Legionella longbeachae]